MSNKVHTKYYVIKFAVFVILAALVFALRAQLVEHLQPFIGSLMIFYGLEEMLYEILCHKLHFIHKSKTYLGLVELIFGTVLLIAPLAFEYVCIIWATWSILRESYEIKEIACELKSIVPKIISGVESIVVIVFSILLLIEPGHHHAMIHLYLLLAELVITPLTPLLDELLEKRK